MNSESTTQPLSYIEVNPSDSPQATVIWLHGLGADGHDFEPIAPQLQSKLPVPTRFVFPHAPYRPITINNSCIMRAWYDIAVFDLTRAEDADGIRASASLLDTLIQREIDDGIAAQRIVLAGFSQGGAVSLHAGLRYPHRLAGILALSTYLPLAATIADEQHPANRNIFIFMAHGNADTVVPLPQALASQRLLHKMGYQVEWHRYEMPHSLCNEELTDITAWLTRRLTT